ncbi:MAG: Gfo/Idh/MocA family protein [Saccharofermentanales bacterium]|jgi:predicted dehydrogenase
MFKAGLWGNGFVAGSHVEALRTLGVEVVAVCGRDFSKTEKFAEKFGIPLYGTEPDLILDHKEIDVIHITTPPTLHTDMVKRALGRQKHVLCEKPLCLANEDALELRRVAQESERRVAVNFNFRCYQAVGQVRDFVRAGGLGELRLVRASFLQEFHALPAEYGWRYDEQIAGQMRAISELGSHVVDMVMYLTGQTVSSVSAQSYAAHPSRKLRDNYMYVDGEGQDVVVNSEDVAVMNLRLSGGAFCTIVLSEISHGRHNRFSVELSGDMAGIWWNSEEANWHYIGRKNRGIQSYVNGFGDGFNDTFSSHFRRAYQYFATGDANGVATLEDGILNVEILNAALESSREGGVIIQL